MRCNSEATPADLFTASKAASGIPTCMFQQRYDARSGIGVEQATIRTKYERTTIVPQQTSYYIVNFLVIFLTRTVTFCQTESESIAAGLTMNTYFFSAIAHA